MLQCKEISGMQIMLGEVPTQTSVLHLGRSLKQKSILQNTFPSSEVTLTLFWLLSVNQSPLAFHSAEVRQRRCVSLLLYGALVERYMKPTSF